MRWLIGSFLAFFGRFIFSLRYKIKIVGRKNLKKKNFNKKSGILFLPNHPALVDPIFITMLLWPRFKVHPLVVEYVYRQTGINAIMRLVKAYSIPNLDTSLNEIKIRSAQGVIEKIITGIKEKENYVLYPSGRLKHTGKEIVGGASATQAILQECPDTNIVLIRTTGLWGSSFSRAYTGRSPDFKSTVKKNVKDLFKSLIFFMPKRKVTIEIELPGEDFPKKGTRLEINRYLEKWYNQYPIDDKRVENEPLMKVSYSCFKKKFYEIKVKEKRKERLGERKYSSKIEETIFSELSRRQPDVEVKEDMHLSADLGLDSLDVAELITFINVHFDVGEIHPEDIETVRDVLEVASGRKIQRKPQEPLSTYTWPKDAKRKEPILPQGKTIVESFLFMCDRMKNHPACGDDMVGVLTYKRMKLAALALSHEIKKMHGTHIGVLIPSTAGTYIVILAILLAKKVPVMLNWTLGPRYLNHMVSLTHTKSVISSWRFLERLSNVEFGALTQKLHLLEDIKKQITKTVKLRAFFQSKKKAKTLLNSLKLDTIKEEDEAVILFTSGTEANPKGVPLTHKNILSNLKEAMGGVTVTSKDILFGILPPFHSFGFSVAGLFPLLCGMRVAYSPDPTDSYTLAECIARWKITLLCAAPSFLKGILQAATKEQLKTVHLFVSGAEKAPKQLYDKVAKLGNDKKLLEGYGITECSPILTLMRENKKPVGVGELLPGIEFCTVNPETHKKLPSVHDEGEMCVRGPNIFSGYIGKQKDPFLMIDGKKWYCTGDLGYLDKEGNVILSGRLKRFTKIGGEMISLGGIEEIILKTLHVRNVDLGEGAPIAVLALEKEEGKSELILFTTLDLTKAEVNTILREAGCSRLIKISEVKKIDQIPLMGTGKIDYRFLQKMIE